MRNGKIKIQKNKHCSIMLSAAVWFVPLRTMLIKVGNILYPGMGGICSKLSIILFLVILVTPMLKNFTITKDFCQWICFVGLSWVISLIFHIEYFDDWVSEAVRIFVRAMPFYLFVQNINDWREAKYIFYRAAVVTVMFMLLYTLLGKYTDTLFDNGYQYNQFNGVITAGAATTCIIAWLDEKKLVYMFATLLSIGIIILFGARMPIMCVSFGFILFIICRIQKGYGKEGFNISQKGFILLMVIGIALIIGLITVGWLMKQEMTSIREGQRIIYQIINGEFFKSNGRIQIYEAAWKGIVDSPIVGHGIISDRLSIAFNQWGNTENFMGTYAHNLFLELWLQYGIILGGALIGLIIIIVMKLLFDNKMEWDKKMIVIYAIAMTFGILLFSGPIYSNKEFWMMTGFGSVYFVRRTKCIVQTTFTRTDVEIYKTRYEGARRI